MGLTAPVARYHAGNTGVDDVECGANSANVGIAVLGPLEVNGAGDGLRRRDRVVLAVLAMQVGQMVSPDRLADALWSELPPPSWNKVIQGCISRTRRLLGHAAIETTDHGYRLVIPSEEIDARRFERMVGRTRELLTLGEPERAGHVIAEALELWRGNALVDLDDWEPGRVEAGRLEELRLDAEELRLEAALRAGRYREVLAEAQARVANAPLRERRWALLALAQYQAGRQGEALRTLRKARAILVNDLGLDPGPDLAALEEAILRQDPALVADTALPEPSATCPYMGLVPYDVADAEAFFGRDADVDACLHRLTTEGVLVIVGPSGCGKSSLVRAGVAASLERDGHRVAVITPGSRPSQALTAVPRSGARPVLVVDQCEEVLTLCDDAEERDRLFSALTAHAERGWLVVALRADSLGEVSRYPGFARLTERGLYMLGPMGESDLRAAIEGPAHLAGLLLEPGLVDLLVREVEGEPGALPLLSHALQVTWEFREGRTLTVAGYRQTGGIQGAVAQSAEEVYESVAPEQRAVFRNLLLRLVSTGPEGEPLPVRVPRRQIATDPSHNRMIESLVDARLVTSDDDVIEIAHESLARAWPRLRAWLDDDVEGQRILRHLSVAADTWLAMDRPDSELYRGVRLSKAIEWRESVEPHLTPTEQEFLDASVQFADAEQEAEEKQRRREMRLRRRAQRLLGVAAVLLVTTSLAAYGFVQRNEANLLADQLAASTEPVSLASHSVVVGETENDPELAMLLALASLDSSANANLPALREAEEALHWAIQGAGVPYPITDGPVEVRLGPDGPAGIYRLPLEQLVKMAQDYLHGRMLTNAECERFDIERCPTGESTWPAVPAVVGASSATDTLQQLTGTTVALTLETSVAIAGEYNDTFREETRRFQDQSGIKVDSLSSDNILNWIIKGAQADVPFLANLEINAMSSDRILKSIIGSALTDVAFVSRPVLDSAARNGHLIDLGSYLDLEQVRRQVGESLTELGRIGDGYYGVPLRVTVNGLVWYPKPEFEQAGYTIPRTWDELLRLSEQIAADGRTPWCLGLASDDHYDGWPATDWIEALILRIGGVERYDQWLSHEIDFQHPVVREAFTRFGEIAFPEGFIQGGIRSASRLNWLDAAKSLTNSPPECWLLLGPSILPRSLPVHWQIGSNVSYFPLPPMTQGESTPLFGELTFAVALHDRPEVRAFMQRLLEAEWGEAWASSVGVPLFANVRLKPEACGGPRLIAPAGMVEDRIRLCQLTRDAIASDQWRPDASEVMPSDVAGIEQQVGGRGAGVRGAFLKGVEDYVKHGPGNLDQILAEIDASWPQRELGE